MSRHKALKKLNLPRGVYTTRQLLPGDVFELPDDKNGRLLSRVYRARKVAEDLRNPVAVPPPPPAVAAKIAATVVVPSTPPNDPNPPAPPPADDIATVRAEYVAAVGRNPFMGWDVGALREKIAAAKAES